MSQPELQQSTLDQACTLLNGFEPRYGNDNLDSQIKIADLAYFLEEILLLFPDTEVRDLTNQFKQGIKGSNNWNHPMSLDEPVARELSLNIAKLIIGYNLEHFHSIVRELDRIVKETTTKDRGVDTTTVKDRITPLIKLINRALAARSILLPRKKNMGEEIMEKLAGSKINISKQVKSLRQLTRSNDVDTSERAEALQNRLALITAKLVDSHHKYIEPEILGLLIVDEVNHKESHSSEAELLDFYEDQITYFEGLVERNEAKKAIEEVAKQAELEKLKTEARQVVINIRTLVRELECLTGQAPDSTTPEEHPRTLSVKDMRAQAEEAVFNYCKAQQLIETCIAELERQPVPGFLTSQTTAINTALDIIDEAMEMFKSLLPESLYDAINAHFERKNKRKGGKSLEINLFDVDLKKDNVHLNWHPLNELNLSVKLLSDREIDTDPNSILSACKRQKADLEIDKRHLKEELSIAEKIKQENTGKTMKLSQALVNLRDHLSDTLKTVKKAEIYTETARAVTRDVKSIYETRS